MSLLDRRLFYKWLVTQNQNNEVGVRRMPCLCPIAKYLLSKDPNPEGIAYWVETFGIKRISVPSEKQGQLVSSVTHAEIKTPPWAKQFIIKVDSRIQKSITAREAIDLLDAVPRRS